MAEATLLVLLFRRKLARRYRAFVLFLIVEWVQMAALLSLDPNSMMYAKCWAASEILLLFALALAAIEVTQKILEHYPLVREMAISSFGMIFTFGAVAATVLLMPFLQASRWQSEHTYFVLKVLRWGSMTLFAFLAAQVLWFKVFPIQMRRNVGLHRWLLALYGGAVPGGSVFLYDLFDKNQNARAWINVAMMGLQICLMTAWCLWFTEKGEQEEAPGMITKALKHPEHQYATKAAWDLPISSAQELLKSSKHSEKLGAANRQESDTPEVDTRVPHL
jgi:hypothetical protein